MNTAVTQQPNIIAQTVANLLAKLGKAGHLVWRPTDNKTILEHLGPHFDKMPNVVNWARTKEDGGNVPDNWSGVLIVNTKGKKGETHVSQTRLLAFPDMDEVFADKTMRGMLFDKYISALARSAKDPEAEENAFSTLNGPWADEGKSAYTFQAEAWVQLICEKSEDKDGMKKVLNTRTLRLALESAEYAKSRFPGIVVWDKIITMMTAKAASSGFSTALFDHWKNTRDVVADTRKIGVPGLDADTDSLLAALGPTKQAA